MRYDSEVDVREMLGIESWRNLSKDTFLQFLETMPEIDREVALQLITQIPEITTSAKAALDEAAKAYHGLLDSNGRSMEMLHQIQLEQLSILRAELDRDPTPEGRLRILEEIRDVHLSAIQKDTENKRFLAEQFGKMLSVVLAAIMAVIAVVLAAAKSGKKSGASPDRPPSA